MNHYGSRQIWSEHCYTISCCRGPKLGQTFQSNHGWLDTVVVLHCCSIIHLRRKMFSQKHILKHIQCLAAHGVILRASFQQSDVISVKEHWETRDAGDKMSRRQRGNRASGNNMKCSFAGEDNTKKKVLGL